MRKHLELPKGILVVKQVTPGAYEGSQLYPIYMMEVPLLRAVENNLQSGRCFFVGEPQEDTISLPGMPGLCSLGRRYSLEILRKLGLK